MTTEILRVTNLTLSEADELLVFLNAELPPQVRPEGFQILSAEEAERTIGLPFLIEPAIVLAFAKGFAGAVGAGFGKLLFDKLRQWASSRKETEATLVKGDKATLLSDLPQDIDQ